MITGTLQYLLIKLAEEATELSNAASKAAIFGLAGKAGVVHTNKDNVDQEFNDVYAILLLIDRVTDIMTLPDAVSVSNKLERLAKFTHESAKLEGVSTEVAENLQDCVDFVREELKDA